MGNIDDVAKDGINFTSKRNWDKDPEEVEEKPKMLYKMCDKCDFEGKAKSNSGLYSTMAAHERKKHK